VQAVSEDTLFDEYKMRKRRPLDLIDHQEQRLKSDSSVDHLNSLMSNRFDAAQKKSISIEEFCSKNKYKQQELSHYKRSSNIKYTLNLQVLVQKFSH